MFSRMQTIAGHAPQSIEAKRLAWLGRQKHGTLGQIARETATDPGYVKAVFTGERVSNTGLIEKALAARGCPGFSEK